jgi:hypothetical protein
MSKNLLTMTEFCEKHDLNKNSFESMKSRGYYPKHIFSSRLSEKDIYIDENYFVIRKEKIKKLWLRACENYYILNENINDYRLAKMLNAVNGKKSVNSWTMFLYENLFNPPPERITNTHITQGVYLFLRYSNWLIRRGT